MVNTERVNVKQALKDLMIRHEIECLKCYTGVCTRYNTILQLIGELEDDQN